MWKRNLFFVAVTVSVVGWLVSEILSHPQLPSRSSLRPPEPGSGHHASSVRPTAAAVDAEFQTAWDEAGLKVAPPADDLLVARRLALALMGTIPSLEEIRALEAVPADQRVQWWLTQIFADRRYADYVAERFTRAFVGTQEGPFLVFRRRRFASWLSDQFKENRPYDEIVREIVADTGLWTDSPAVNFVTVTLDENDDGRPDPIRLAARTSRAFLGMRIDCLQCHDDALGTIELGTGELGTGEELRGGLQRDFHQLAAFFSEAKSSLLGVHDESHPYRVQYLDAEQEELVSPVPPFYPDLLPANGSRRRRLARWLTHPENRPFARAIVNRIWALLWGKPLVEPIDDIPLAGDFPPGFERLADDLIEHDYDLQRLIRVIASTEAFRLDSRANFPIEARHEAAWATFPLTRLRPEQMAGSAIQAASVKTIDDDSHILFQLQRFGEQNDFIKRYGDTGEDEFAPRSGTIPQRLLVMNGKLVKERTKQNLVGNAATRIGALASSDERAVDFAFLAVLTRQPTTDERQHFAKRLAQLRGAERSRQMEDLYWVLLNSTEFSWNH